MYNIIIYTSTHTHTHTQSGREGGDFSTFFVPFTVTWAWSLGCPRKYSLMKSSKELDSPAGLRTWGPIVLWMRLYMWICPMPICNRDRLLNSIITRIYIESLIHYKWLFQNVVILDSPTSVRGCLSTILDGPGKFSTTLCAWTVSTQSCLSNIHTLQNAREFWNFKNVESTLLLGAKSEYLVSRFIVSIAKS